MSKECVGVIGSGSFGTAVSNILAKNSDVILYVRNTDTIERIKTSGLSSGQSLSTNVTLTNDLEEVAKKCNVIFPVIPSSGFRDLMRQFAPFLHPYHVLIHGTKGLDLVLPEKITPDFKLDRSRIRTMSEVIREESVVVRVGCMAGPNLAKELALGHPAATVIASPFNEVINEGKRLLKSDKFQVYGNPDLKGVELCGILKNIIAIASGIISGLGFGDNAKGLLISRGLVEMIYLGKALGGEISSFIGLAGIGDLVATASSQTSRNYTIGFKLAEGKTMQQALDEMEETAEGVNTIRIIKQLADAQGIRPLITDTLYKILYEDMKPQEGLNYLMKYPGNIDIDFL